MVTEARILLLDPENYSEDALAILGAAGAVDARTLSRRELVAKIGAYDAVVLRFSHRIDGEVLAAAGRLRVIATNATGLDHIDIAAAEANGVAVLSLKGETAFLESVSATAEHTWALLLALTRRLVPAARSVLDGAWDRDRFVGADLAGKRLGIAGLGRIGRKVAGYGRAFGMEVGAHDPAVTDAADDIGLFPTLGDLAARTDALCIHAPSTADTKRMIDAAILARLPAGAVLVNTARAALVDEAALIAALRSGHLSGAAVDGLEGELAPGFLGRSALAAYARDNPNLIITPHLGGATREAWRSTEIFLAGKVRDCLSGKSAAGGQPRKKGDRPR